MKKIFITFLLSVGISLSFYAQVYHGVLKSDYDALIALYNSTDGANWTNKWDTTTDVNGTSPWFGVTVVSQRVTKISLKENNLSGTLPADLGNLSELTYIRIAKNPNLIGNIPTEIGQFTKLEYLYFYGNQLTGSIPTEIGQLTKLKNLYFWGNNLTGNIPTEIGNLTNLIKLYLGSNQLTGSIPTEIGQLTELEKISIWGNKLTGSIPKEIYNLPNLYFLKLDDNKLSGKISSDIGKLTNLQRVYFGGNLIGGALPAEVNTLTKLTHLNLADGQFDSLPNLSALTKLAWVRMDGNSFDFGDLKRANMANSSTPLVHGNTYKYARQSNVKIKVETVGNKTTIKCQDDSVEHNTYKWYKNDMEMPGTNVQNYTIDISDEGVYYCEITNSDFTKLAIKTEVAIVGENNDYKNGVLKQDYEALVALYNSTNGSNWTNNTNWLSDKNVAEWYGVKVNGGRVSYIDLNGNMLQGTIPAELLNLDDITFINMANNLLTGTFPSKTGPFFTKLTWLEILNNKIDSLPDLSASPLEWYLVQNNALDFGDLAGAKVNIEHSLYNQYMYSDQAKVDISITKDGDKITLKAEDKNETHNTYQWYKDGVLIPSATNQSYEIADGTLPGVKGAYYCEIKNTYFTRLDLQTKTANVQQATFNVDLLNKYYGTLKIGATAEQEFVMSNTGTNDLEITKFELIGTNKDDFTCSMVGTQNISIAPNAKSSFTVIFKPLSSGSKTAKLRITSNTGTHDISLSGDAISVDVTCVSLSETTKNIKVGKNFTLTATVTPNNATDTTVTWASSKVDIATVDNSGKVTALKAGTTIITATTTDGNFTATCNVTVEQPVTGISLSETTKTIKVGDTFTLTATATPDDAADKTVTWTSSDETLATVDNSGKVTGIKAGDVTITASCEEGTVTATCTVTITQAVAGISLDKDDIVLKVGMSETLVATVSPTNATDKTVTWASSDETVASVDNSGKVTGIKAGDITITAKTTDGNFTATCKVKVEQPVTGISLSETTKTIKVGDTFTLTATVTPDDAADKTVTWTSSDETVATVTQEGLVTAITLGSADIVATTTDGGHSATCKLSIVTGINNVEISKIMVYPNPAPNGNIKIKTNKDCTLKITSISGKVIQQKEIVSSAINDIHISKSGVYIFIFNNNKDVLEIKRVVIQ